MICSSSWNENILPVISRDFCLIVNRTLLFLDANRLRRYDCYEEVRSGEPPNFWQQGWLIYGE